MTTIKAVIRNRRVDVPAPNELPDGTEVELTISALPNLPFDVEFMTEEEQSDDPEAIRQWSETLHALPPVPYDPVELAEWEAWQARMKQFNVEAMRKQFGGGAP